VTQISECTLDSVITPGDILHGHAYNQFGDLLRDAVSSWPLSGIGPFLCDEFTVPCKLGIRGNECFDYTKQTTAKNLGFSGQSPTLIAGEPKTLSFELIFESTILFDEIVDDILLQSV